MRLSRQRSSRAESAADRLAGSVPAAAYPDDDQPRRLNLVEAAVARVGPGVADPLLAAVDHLRSLP